MLGSKKGAIGVAGGTTLISRDTVIIGDIHFSGNLDIEGLVQGNIYANPDKDACVRVVDKGRVEGDISAPSVVVNGTIEGDVHSTAHLELAPKARVQGNVLYTLVEMAAGSEVNGSLQHLDAASGAELVASKSPDLTVAVTEAGDLLAQVVPATKSAKS
jgi:cytoskeletal protein CcmA (bactofilin family)